MSEQLLHGLRMNLTDVSSLAQVQRPVVSMWRKRHRMSASPFPDPVGMERGLEVFDAQEIATWLDLTGRGNNTEAKNEFASFARLALLSQPGPVPNLDHGFAALSALLTLKALTGSMLGALSHDEILDAAEDEDPDDCFLYREIEALGPTLTAAACYADQLADSSYSTAAAFEKLLSDRFRPDLRGSTGMTLAEPALDLVAGTALELARTLDAEPVFVDPAAGSSDLLSALARTADDPTRLAVLTANDGGPAARLAWRRFATQGIDQKRLVVESDGSFNVHGPAVHLAQYPSPSKPGITPAEILDAIDHIVLQMDDSHRAVIVAPARILSDALADPALEGQRSSQLRSGRVRAIVRLPRGLLRSKPREAQTLWVLGPSFADVPIAERWTMTSELEGEQLSVDVRQDLISDIVASIGDRRTMRAHSFRFARLVQTRVLLASRGSLVSAQSPGRTPMSASNLGGSAEFALRVEELVRRLQTGSVPPGALSFQPHPGTTATPAVSVQDLLASGTIKLIQGNRLATADLDGRTGARVLGQAELLDPFNSLLRRVPLWTIAVSYPAVRLAEPGDIVFCTSPRPAALVDVEGGSLVVFPARILRIDAGDPAGLVPAVVAADINRLPSADKSWRLWRLRRCPEAQHGALRDALVHVEHEQWQARQRLNRLDELATLIVDGVAGGLLTAPSTTDTVPPTKGTR